MTTPTIKQMRAWQRQLGSMERKADEIAREMGPDRDQALWQIVCFCHDTIADLTGEIIAAKSDARRQGFASMAPERVAELSRLAVEAKRLKKTV